MRSKYGTGEESDDILKAWTNDRQVERTFCTHLSNVYHRSSYTTQEVAKLSALRERMLGPADQMTEVKAARDDSGIYVGGIALERSHRAECVKKAPRSYNFGTTWQQSRNLDAPSKNMKASDTGVDEALELRKDILKVRILRWSMCRTLTVTRAGRSGLWSPRNAQSGAQTYGGDGEPSQGSQLYSRWRAWECLLDGMSGERCSGRGGRVWCVLS